MKVLIFVIITTWSFGSPFSQPVTKIVHSPEEAAIIAYQDSRSSFGAEPDRHEYKLYEVDLENGGRHEIPIPKVTFIKEAGD